VLLLPIRQRSVNILISALEAHYVLLFSGDVINKIRGQIGGIKTLGKPSCAGWFSLLKRL
jgi:hypothetical protein